MTIPSVMQGLIETEDGKVFELDSPKGFAWLESIGSFRFEPSGDNKPYTVRKEAGIYWYGCRKVAGKVRKKYIGKSSEVSIAKLEEIAEALEISPEPRVKQVAQVAEKVAERPTEVAQQVTEIAQDKLTALESRFAKLEKTVEDLREALLGKSESGDSSELPKVDNEVAKRLQNDLGNLQAENEKLRGDYVALLESSTHVTNKLREEVRELRSQLATERADQAEVEAELAELAQLKKEAREAAAEIHREGRSIELEKIRWQQQLSDARSEIADAKATILKQSDKIRELERGYNFKPTPAESRLRLEIGELQEQLADLKQNSATASKDLPQAADLLNQLKTRRKKSNASLADVELILEMIDD